MAYLCMGCYEVYDRDLGRCPKRDCDAQVVEIDELMLPTIKILNEKGYITDFCCSGHIYDNGGGAYILFDELLTEFLEEKEINYLKNNLPKGWTFEIESLDRICFRYRVNNNNVLATYEEIFQANLSMLRFVEELPVLEY
jgi:hypothetical protein